jgi:hypothetical protein
MYISYIIHLIIKAIYIIIYKVALLRYKIKKLYKTNYILSTRYKLKKQTTIM